MPLLYRQARFQARVEGASLAGAYVMGLAFAFGWTPCIGPVLATVLTLAANEGSLGAGVRLLFVYSLGLGVPFVLAAMAIGPFVAFLQRFRKHLRHVEMVMGVLLVVTGVLMLTGSLNWFGQLADRECAGAGAHRGAVHAQAAADRDPEGGREMTGTPIALTIAGSDSSGGAGIQADLKTFSAFGVYGASVLTALTAQNTRGVTAVEPVAASFVLAQMEAVLSRSRRRRHQDGHAGQRRHRRGRGRSPARALRDGRWWSTR